MVLGIILIFAGILIAIYPKLLAFIVSFLFILGGSLIVFLRYQLRKFSKDWRNPFINFFIRF